MSLQPPRDKRASLAEAVALVSDGAIVALGGGLSARLPMAMVRELIRQGRRGLHLVGSAHSIDVDLLVAAGAVRRCEESYVGFEQDLGLAPAYRRAAEEGSIEVAESCCVSLLAQLRATEMGVPFLPVRGVRGSDIAALHPEYATITCPFTGETLIAVPALRPDVALLHAPSGDRYGNLHLEQPYVLDERFACAARAVVATADKIVSPEEITAAGITIPGHLVAAVTEVPFGMVTVERGLRGTMRSCSRSSGKPRMCRLASQVSWAASLSRLRGVAEIDMANPVGDTRVILPSSRPRWSI